MSDLLAELEGRVGICPTCGKNAEICVMTSVTEPDKHTFQWVCWHPAEDGKSRADLMAVLYEAGENKYKFWTAEGFFLLDEKIYQLSAEYGIDLRKHNQGDSFDFGTWWEEFISYEPIEKLNRLLPEMPDEDSWLLQTLRKKVMGELERRKTVGMASSDK